MILYNSKVKTQEEAKTVLINALKKEGDLVDEEYISFISKGNNLKIEKEFSCKILNVCKVELNVKWHATKRRQYIDSYTTRTDSSGKTTVTPNYKTAVSYDSGVENKVFDESAKGVKCILKENKSNNKYIGMSFTEMEQAVKLKESSAYVENKPDSYINLPKISEFIPQIKKAFVSAEAFEYETKIIRDELKSWITGQQYWSMDYANFDNAKILKYGDNYVCLVNLEKYIFKAQYKGETYEYKVDGNGKCLNDRLKYPSSQKVFDLIKSRYENSTLKEYKKAKILITIATLLTVFGLCQIINLWFGYGYLYIDNDWQRVVINIIAVLRIIGVFLLFGMFGTLSSFKYQIIGIENALSKKSGYLGDISTRLDTETFNKFAIYIIVNFTIFFAFILCNF